MEHRLTSAFTWRRSSSSSSSSSLKFKSPASNSSFRLMKTCSTVFHIHCATASSWISGLFLEQILPIAIATWVSVSAIATAMATGRRSWQVAGLSDGKDNSNDANSNCGGCSNHLFQILQSVLILTLRFFRVKISKVDRTCVQNRFAGHASSNTSIDLSCWCSYCCCCIGNDSASLVTKWSTRRAVAVAADTASKTESTHSHCLQSVQAPAGSSWRWQFCGKRRLCVFFTRAR